jgi:hypothetical protein
MRDRLDRTMLGAAAIAAAGAALLLVRPTFVTDAWPFPQTSDPAFIFLASILAAAAASTSWAALLGERLSYVGIALDMLVIFVPLVLYLLLLDPARGGGFSAVLLAAVAIAVGGAGLLLRSWGVPPADPRPTPRLVLIAFAVFAVALVLVGGALVVRAPYVVPWRVTPELSAITGLIFLGAAAYFLFGLVRPRWSNAGGQLAGFLAYDLVLIGPLVTRLPTVPDYWRVSLIAYIVVLVVSGVLAAWYLFLDPRTRIGSGHAARTG